ncbi:hypothetical protein D3C86_1473600 [compost metagenome]
MPANADPAAGAKLNAAPLFDALSLPVPVSTLLKASAPLANALSVPLAARFTAPGPRLRVLCVLMPSSCTMPALTAVPLA